MMQPSRDQKRRGKYTYDFVLSFAGEDREIVEEVKRVLEQNHFKVFYDLDEKEVLLGKDLAEYFSKLYQEDGKYCVMFISKHYIRKPWTRWERRAALARAFKSRKEYILPYFLDNSKLLSMPQTIGRVKFPDVSPKEFATLLVRKYYQEHNSLEIMDGIFIKNPEPPGRTLTAYEEGYIADVPLRFRDEEPLYGYELGVRLNFSVVNTHDIKLEVHSNTALKDDNHSPCRWSRRGGLIQLNQLCEPTGSSYSPIYVEPHEMRNFGFNICSFCWEQTWDWEESNDYKPHTFEKFGPAKVLANFSGEVGYSENLEEVLKPLSKMTVETFNDAMEEVLKSLSKNEFEIFDGVKLDICMTLHQETKTISLCIETVIYENKAQFMKVRKVQRGYFEGFAELH